MRMYIVLACRPENFGKNLQHPGAFTGPDKDVLIRKAMAVRQSWYMDRTGHKPDAGPYDIYVGEITEKVAETANWQLVPLTE